MPDLIKGNAIIGQSGGPTAVINQSLAGVIEGLRAGLVRRGFVKTILGMRHGVNGLVKDQVVDLTKLAKGTLEAVARTPSAALGSSRDKPDRDYCNAILNACSKHGVKYFFYIGGNDSSDTCRIVSELAAEAGDDLRCFHVPKTVDNDLMGNDHTPGFPSAARFVATAFMADGMDNASLPGIKINVVMGRHAGFLTAASALAREVVGGKTGSGGKGGRGAAYVPGPHLIYLPEVPFDPDRFVADVDAVYKRIGRCQVAVSEGIQDKHGKSIGSTLLPSGDVDAHGNVQLSGTGALGDALAELCKKRIRTSSGKTPRVRADTFGYLQRCWPDASPADAQEARAVGAFAATLAAAGERSGSVAILRAKGKSYKVTFARQELSAVAAKTRHMPPAYIKSTNDVTPAFMDYIRPLVGPLPAMARL
ncbi:MAG: 6-phosphofructokinase [Phycisphaerales bacterium]